MARFVFLAWLVAFGILGLGYTSFAQSSTAGIAKATETTDASTDPLGLAADCLSRGDDVGAARYLAKHVAAHPDQVVFRAQLAELFARLDRHSESQAQFESAIALAQDGPKPARDRLVHYHTRLMETARTRKDTYNEHLHRGIGLFVVASRLAESNSTADVERLLFKAIGALKEAQAQRPEDARPAWYLHCAWRQLDQPRPAEAALRTAINAAPFSYLTPAEARELALAGARPQLRR